MLLDQRWQCGNHPVFKPEVGLEDDTEIILFQPSDHGAWKNDARTWSGTITGEASQAVFGAGMVWDNNRGSRSGRFLG